MNSFSRIKIIAAMSLTMAVTDVVGRVQAQPVPPPASSGTLPAGIVPGSPLAEVVKLIQAGVDIPTIQSYIANSQSPFNSDADKIIFLKDEGAPSEIINAMMNHDKDLSAAAATPASPPAPPAAPPITVDTTTPPNTTDATDTSPPEDVTLNYFYDTLTPYGSWLNVDGYGQCWRPTAVIYDATWRPYCDRGHWVYTDYGWYWDSDYGWGATFHYGRWFHHPRFGWCWYPDNVWAPSWVTWRADANYCGWAPLPPFAVFSPDGGFFFRGVSVGLDFDFGLQFDCFVFVPSANFCDRHPKSVVVQQQYVAQIFNRTKVINSYDVSGKTIVNHGIGVDRIAGVTHHSIEPVRVSGLPNAGRQGWRGEGFQRTMTQHSSVPGPQPTGYQTEISRSPASGGHVQSQATFNWQPTRPNNLYAEPNHVASPNGWPQGSAGVQSVGGSQPRSAEQFQERQSLAPPPQRVEERPAIIEPAAQKGGEVSVPPPPPASAPQPRSSGNSSSTGGSGNNSNKQNH